YRRIPTQTRAPKGNRTLDLLLTMETLCRLSYRGSDNEVTWSGPLRRNRSRHIGQSVTRTTCRAFPPSMEAQPRAAGSHRTSAWKVVHHVCPRATAAEGAQRRRPALEHAVLTRAALLRDRFGRGRAGAAGRRTCPHRSRRGAARLRTAHATAG